MNDQQAFWRWATIGAVTGVFLIWTQTLAVGGVTGLLGVGELSALRPMIEDQLGAVALAEGSGHDGQISYAIGLDLTGGELGPLLDHAAYRYRRILLPLLASGFGLLEGHALLYGQIVVCILSMAVSAGLVAAMGSRAGKKELLALVVLLNPGVWLSVRLLTADVLALALMLAGLSSLARGDTGKPGVGFALGGLAKDVILATPIPLAVANRHWKMVSITAAPLLVWSALLQLQFGEGFAPRGNLDLPFAGLVAASANWVNLDGGDVVYLTLALGLVALGAIFSFRRTWLQWPIVAWTVLGLISSNWVWDFGNNALRAFAPIAVLVALTVLGPGRYSAPGGSLAARLRGGIQGPK